GIRSVRAGRLLREKTKRLLEYRGNCELKRSEVDEVVARCLYCTKGETELDSESESGKEEDSEIRIPFPNADKPITVKFSELSKPVEETFFLPLDEEGAEPPGLTLHDEEDDPPLPNQLYAALLSLPIDVRATVISRIVFVGAVS